MAWTIKASVFQLPGSNGHLFLEFFNDSGVRVHQFHGFATNRTTGEPEAFGGPEDQLRAWFWDPSVTHFDNYYSSAQTQTIFSGTEAQVQNAIDHLREYQDYINALDIVYNLNWPSIADIGYNSNSVFAGAIDVLNNTLSLNSSNLATVTGYTDVPGYDDSPFGNDDDGYDIFTVLEDGSGNVTGIRVDDTGKPRQFSLLSNAMIGSDGDDELYALSGDDTLYAGTGSDILHGGTEDSNGDIADYTKYAGDVTVILSGGGGSVAKSGGGTDILYDIEHVRGSDGNDEMYGDAVDTDLHRFFASLGNDEYYGGANNVVDYTDFSEAVTMAFSSSGGVVTKGTAGALGEDTLTDVVSVVGTRFADTFTGSFQDENPPLYLAGGEGSDRYVFNLLTDSGYVNITDNQALGLDALTVQNFNSSTMEASFYVSGDTFFLSFAEWNGSTYETFFEVRLHQDDSGPYQSVETFTLASNTYLFANLYAYSNALGIFYDDELSEVNGYGSGGWLANAGGGLLPTFDGGGNITSVRYAPTATGNYIPYQYGTEVWHPGVITSLTSNSLTINSALKAVDFHDGLSIDEVRLTLSGTQGNASLVINLDGFGESFTIPYFETGETISGIAPYGAAVHDWVQDSSSGAFSGSGNSIYSGTFTNANSHGISGTYSDTFFLEALNFYDGTINTLGNLTFEGTNSNNTLTGLDNRADTIYGYGGVDTLYGYGGNDTLIGGAGDDSIRGGAGNDTYIFAAGFESDTIVEAVSSGTDTLRFTGFAAADMRMWTGNGTFYIASRVNPGDQIFIAASTTGAAGTNSEITIGDFVEQVIFDDATWSLTGGLILEGSSANNIIYGSQYNDTIYGMDGVDTLYGNRGNDTLNSGAGDDNLRGGAGDDTYAFASGWGSDTLQETSTYGGAGNDTVRLTGFNAADIRMWTGNGAFYIASKANPGDQIFIAASTTGAAGTNSEITIGDFVEQVIFDDATWSLTGGLTLEGSSANNIIYGSQYNDTIYGMDGIDTLYGNRGNDTLNGGAGDDNLRGGAGDDTYVFASGWGSDTLQETSTYGGAGNDTVRLTGFNAADIRMWTGNGAFYIASKANPGDQIFIAASTTGAAGTNSEITIGDFVEQVIFDDATWSLTSGLTLEGSSTNNIIYGSQYNDTIYGMDGVDTLYGNRGNDTLIGGVGNDTLNGADGNDILYGGAGTDSLSGGNNADTFIFEAATAFGASDTIADFSTAQTDVLDIDNLLSGYDPLTDLISDFVRITDNGSSSVLSVDADGGANGFVQIATLTSVTNIAAGATATEGELQTLIANGMLIAA